MLKIKHPTEEGKEIRVLWRHYPPQRPDWNNLNTSANFVLSRKQGATQCLITVGNSTDAVEKRTLLGTGVATQSAKDQFNRRVGRKVSLTRAIKESTTDKSLRQYIWENYFKAQNIHYV